MPLREISGRRLKRDDLGYKCRWFQGEGEVDLFSWEDEDGNIVRQQLTFAEGKNHYVVDWEPKAGIRTGEVSKGRNIVAMEDVIQFYSKVSDELLLKAKSILSNSGIDPKVSGYFLDKLNNESGD